MLAQKLSIPEWICRFKDLPKRSQCSGAIAGILPLIHASPPFAPLRTPLPHGKGGRTSCSGRQPRLPVYNYDNLIVSAFCAPGMHQSILSPLKLFSPSEGQAQDCCGPSSPAGDNAGC